MTPELGSPQSRTSPEVVFGAVSTESAVTAVLRRLRAAIALGFLSDGDRLPPEVDLVAQLGVTAFALREALALLREEGLIETRRGKNGGSFITNKAGRTPLMTEELRRMSAIELRDLGDWRQMVASVSASLAARRASTSNCNRLREYAEEIGSAGTALEAWRAHGRFHVELAAAAQSIRMTRAEFAMYEEFDWLLELALGHSRRREQSSRELVEVAAAVADRLPDEARAAAERHSASALHALVKLRLESIASDPVRGRDSPGRNGASAAGEITRMLSAVTGVLDGLAAEAASAMELPPGEDELRSRLSGPALAGLLESTAELEGVGYVAAPGAVPGREFWIAAWNRTPDGVSVDNSHAMDPGRADFYDYVKQDFYAVPLRTGKLWAQGPYVDYGGRDDYIVTFSKPVNVGGRFVGVVAADIAVASIEAELAPWLTMDSDVRIVISAERRVIAGSSANNVVGDVLSPTAGSEVEQIPEVGWSVVREAAEPGRTPATIPDDPDA